VFTSIFSSTLHQSTVGMASKETQLSESSHVTTLSSLDETLTKFERHPRPKRKQPSNGFDGLDSALGENVCHDQEGSESLAQPDGRKRTKANCVFVGDVDVTEGETGLWRANSTFDSQLDYAIVSPVPTSSLGALVPDNDSTNFQDTFGLVSDNRSAPNLEHPVGQPENLAFQYEYDDSIAQAVGHSNGLPAFGQVHDHYNFQSQEEVYEQENERHFHIPKLDGLVTLIEEAVIRYRARQNTGYDSVHVILMTWEYSDLDLTQEISRLENIFKTCYRYKVDRMEISTTGGNWRNEFCDLLKDYVYSRDKDGKNLFLIYYAGHGMQSFWGKNEMAS
jgi:hypothetical protein